MKTKKLTTLSMLTAIALTIFMVEAQIPPLTPIPGIKMGLSGGYNHETCIDPMYFREDGSIVPVVPTL